MNLTEMVREANGPPLVRLEHNATLHFLDHTERPGVIEALWDALQDWYEDSDG